MGRLAALRLPRAQTGVHRLSGASVLCCGHHLHRRAAAATRTSPSDSRRGDADAAQCRDADVDALAEALNAHGATRPAGQHLSLLRLLTALRSCTSPFPTVRLTCPKSFFVSPVALSAVLQLGLRICVHGDGVTRSGRASRPVLPRQIAQLGRSFEHEHMASRPRPNHWHALRSPCRRCRLRPTICCVCVV